MLPALDEALTRLEQLDPEQARIVELRYFAGLGIEETADALGISPATLKRRWALARAWLFRELTDPGTVTSADDPGGALAPRTRSVRGARSISRPSGSTRGSIANRAAIAQIRADVRSLLDHHQRTGSFLVEPLGNRMADLMGETRVLQPGDRLGSYTIVREVGRGGMGRVYLATDATARTKRGAQGAAAGADVRYVASRPPAPRGTRGRSAHPSGYLHRLRPRGARRRSVHRRRVRRRHDASLSAR